MTLDVTTNSLHEKEPDKPVRSHLLTRGPSSGISLNSAWLFLLPNSLCDVENEIFFPLSPYLDSDFPLGKR